MNKSPFPGMDPYLERHWGDVHHSLVIYARDQLRPNLPPSLRALAEERVFVEREDDSFQERRPDVYLVEYPGPPGQGTIAVATDSEKDIGNDVQPFFIRVRNEPITEIYLQIIDVASGNRVITVIEFVSPTNKRKGPGRDEYRRERKECLSAEINYVEIDLTRAGRRESIFPLGRIPPAHRDATYLVSIRRAVNSEVAEIYPIPLQARLPKIPIPLRPHDAEVKLDLQALVDQAYIGGSFDYEDYTSNPKPKFSAADAAWMDELLRKAGKRK